MKTTFWALKSDDAITSIFVLYPDNKGIKYVFKPNNVIATCWGRSDYSKSEILELGGEQTTRKLAVEWTNEPSLPRAFKHKN